MTNSSDRQQSVRNFTGSAGSYESDFMALFDAKGIPAGEFNGRMLAWINLRTGATYTNINSALAGLASFFGLSGFDQLGTFVASPAATIVDPSRAYFAGEIEPGLYPEQLYGRELALLASQAPQTFEMQ